MGVACCRGMDRRADAEMPCLRFEVGTVAFHKADHAIVTRGSQALNRVVCEAGLCPLINVGFHAVSGTFVRQLFRARLCYPREHSESFHVVRNQSNGRLPAPQRSHDQIMTRAPSVVKRRTYLRLRVNRAMRQVPR